MKYTAIILVLVCIVTRDAGGQPHIGAQPAGNYYRSAWDGNVHLAAGSSNGARLGFLLYPTTGISGEMSFGYVRLKRIGAPEGTVELEPVDGYAVSLGMNYLTHPLNDLSPMLSFLLSFNRSIKTDPESDRSRFIFTTAVGAEASLFWRVNFFFRAGPSVHLLSKTDRNAIQMFVHFDGGIGISF